MPAGLGLQTTPELICTPGTANHPRAHLHLLAVIWPARRILRFFHPPANLHFGRIGAYRAKMISFLPFDQIFSSKSIAPGCPAE
jgi:hypothetical protein